MRELLVWGSSKVDWCENNFAVVSGVAEFYNTISNVILLTMPPLFIYLFRPYSKQVDRGTDLVFILMWVIGLGSTYFHWTLSLLGQMIDELAILWILMVTTAIWCPLQRMPQIFKRNRKQFQRALFISSVIFSGLACLSPEVNACVLFLYGIPLTCLLIREYQSSRDWHLRSLMKRSLIIGLIAVALWVNDKFLCEVMWHRFPYLHSVWHILIPVSLYMSCVVFAYLRGLREHPELGIQLRYWPREDGMWEYFGVPYVAVNSSGIASKKA